MLSFLMTPYREVKRGKKGRGKEKKEREGKKGGKRTRKERNQQYKNFAPLFWSIDLL